MAEETSYNLFHVETPPRRWKKPTPSEPRSSVSHLNTEWLGGSLSDLSSSPLRKINKVNNAWFGGSSSNIQIQRPDPIKIEGSSSVKSNPFFGK